MTSNYDPVRYNDSAKESAVMTFLIKEKLAEYRALDAAGRDAFLAENMTPAIQAFLDFHLIVPR